jgi:hypothetical protein
MRRSNRHGHGRQGGIRDSVEGPQGGCCKGIEALTEPRRVTGGSHSGLGMGGGSEAASLYELVPSGLSFGLGAVEIWSRRCLGRGYFRDGRTRRDERRVDGNGCGTASFSRYGMACGCASKNVLQLQADTVYSRLSLARARVGRGDRLDADRQRTQPRRKDRVCDGKGREGSLLLLVSPLLSLAPLSVPGRYGIGEAGVGK